MSASLARRMTKLEAAANPEANGVKLIVRRIIRTESGEVARAIIGDKVVDRQADESEDDFMARSRAEALAGTHRRPARVILLSEQDVDL
ncbi:MAG: hypothetical protein DVS81_15860 [Candidatus Accumulibacter meliphilus]|uniref:Uncharacterized protein n=1 Tax=Candidatus Accumulibacter meliphilus TaxID=2211374 RepID=A0A369XMW6_9PROT|nr:MAG: hypothetical protein DVS81_15860 [Candidatus Accumulibacter meliphilus]